MSEKKSFPTLLIGSVSSGVMLTSGYKYSDIQEVAEWVFGHPVWTHELGSKDLWLKMSKIIIAQFPEMPANDYEPIGKHKAEVLTAKLLKAYGKTVDVERGSFERERSPIDTLVEVANGRPVVVITEDPTNGQ